MPGIEILFNFVCNPRKISPFGKKELSWQNLGLNLTKWLKAVFFW